MYSWGVLYIRENEECMTIRIGGCVMQRHDMRYTVAVTFQKLKNESYSLQVEKQCTCESI